MRFAPRVNPGSAVYRLCFTPFNFINRYVSYCLAYLSHLEIIFLLHGTQHNDV
jgi:hypothetical protein